MTDTTEATGSGWISRWLNPGDTFHNQPLTDTQGGIELFDGTVIVDNVKGLAELGHALVNRYDPPDADTVQAAGLDPTGRDGGPHGWPEVARAAITAPVTVCVANHDTSHYSWQGIGGTPAEARDALMRAWHAHAEATGADPDYIDPEEINVVTGTFGTGFRDFDAFPRP